jgi:hypothetical protein
VNDVRVEDQQLRLMRVALDHAERGYFVFRLLPRSKIPPKGFHGHLEATTNTLQVERWWKERPWNVGLATGPSDKLVVDLDMPKGDGKSGLQTIWERGVTSMR